MNLLLKVSLLVCLVIAAECVPKDPSLSRKKRQAIASSVCSGNECNYGTCEILSQLQFACHCQAGIYGSNCNLQAPANNPCASNPCYNQGTCVNVGTTGWQCVCATGFAGTQCKAVLSTSNQCTCQNGGTCMPVYTSTGMIAYQCNCPTNYGGNQCQFVKSVYQSCQNVGCQNGGYCSIFSTCICPSTFTGTFCQTPVTTAPVTVTVAPVTVTTTAAPVTVTVTAAPVTTTNTFAINVCAPGICLNGGTCYQITYSLALCSCPPGFSGVYCNIGNSVVTSVTSLPGTVTPTTVGPVTVTAATTTAAPTVVTFCATNPCLNGGLCVPTTGTGGRCICNVAFTGFLCETGYSCSNLLCPTGQTCSLVNNIPQCQTVTG